MKQQSRLNTGPFFSILLGAFAVYAPYAIYLDMNEGKERAKNTSFIQQEIGSVKIPGTTLDAKASGFTNCKSTASSLTYECHSTRGITIDGISIANASLQLNTYDNYKTTYSTPRAENLSPEDLTYRGISIHHNPEEIINKLKASGWIEYRERRSQVLYKKGINASVSISSFGGSTAIQLEPATETEVNQAIKAVHDLLTRQSQDAANKIKVEKIMGSGSSAH